VQHEPTVWCGFFARKRRISNEEEMGFVIERSERACESRDANAEPASL
jgi:hypothetical protein